MFETNANLILDRLKLILHKQRDIVNLIRRRKKYEIEKSAQQNTFTDAELKIINNNEELRKLKEQREKLKHEYTNNPDELDSELKRIDKERFRILNRILNIHDDDILVKKLENHTKDYKLLHDSPIKERPQYEINTFDTYRQIPEKKEEIVEPIEVKEEPSSNEEPIIEEHEENIEEKKEENTKNDISEDPLLKSLQNCIDLVKPKIELKKSGKLVPVQYTDVDNLEDTIDTRKGYLYKEQEYTQEEKQSIKNANRDLLDKIDKAEKAALKISTVLEKAINNNGLFNVKNDTEKIKNYIYESYTTKKGVVENFRASNHDFEFEGQPKEDNKPIELQQPKQEPLKEEPKQELQRIEEKAWDISIDVIERNEKELNDQNSKLNDKLKKDKAKYNYQIQKCLNTLDQLKSLYKSLEGRCSTEINSIEKSLNENSLNEKPLNEKTRGKNKKSKQKEKPKISPEQKEKPKISPEQKEKLTNRKAIFENNKKYCEQKQSELDQEIENMKKLKL